MTTGSNLKEILDVMEKRFGRPEMIIRKMIEKARCVTPPMEGDFQSLMDFTIAVKNLCSTAVSLELPLYLNHPQLVEEFRRKLPSGLQLEWGRHVVRKKKEKNLDLLELSSFLDEVSSAAVVVCDSPRSQVKKKNRDQCMVVIECKCLVGCKEAHSLGGCPKFKKMPVHERWEVVKKNGVCFICLTKGHRTMTCPEKTSCKVEGCGRLHNSLLHYKSKVQPKEGAKPHGSGLRREEKSTPVSSENPPSSTANEVFAVMNQVPARVQIGRVLLKVVPVVVTGPKGSLVVNAFLDSGSSSTILDAEIADFLGMDGACFPLHLEWQGGKSDVDPDSKIVSLKIRGVNENEEFELENARTKKNLRLPMQPMSSFKMLKKWSHLEEVPFPEVVSKRPSIVIGLEHNFLLIERKVVEGPRNAPVAGWTFLGWCAYGKNGKSGSQLRSSTMLAVENSDKELHDLVKEQFRLESLGVVNCKKLPQSLENQRAEQLMENYARRIGDCWEAPMLWKRVDLVLPESYKSALSRLRILEKKMDKDDELAKIYSMKIEEYGQKKFCHKLSEEETAVPYQRQWFIPHFGTTNPNKPGKLRMVFDCAAKTNGTSLNNALLQGPDLMATLINVLMKFRQREVAFSGDIRDMFHMVKIRQEDVAALRFLWRGRDRSRPPDVYQMDVMVFGAVSSPFQAQWVKNRNAMEFQETFPEAVDAIVNRHYVDDYLDSCTTPVKAIKKIMEVREIHRRGGFEIRGWLSNVEDVIKVVAPGEKTADQTKDVKEDKLERVLGLHWEPRKDVFKFKAKFGLFDPLGFIAHLTVRGRILLQDIWRSAVGWDDEMKMELRPKWKRFLEQLVKIPEALIPRCFAPDVSNCVDLQLHVMCDASQQAFCAIAFLRTTGRGGDITVNIVMAKSRVTPIRAVSIPRLELAAALVGARMSKFVRDGLDLKISRTVLWSDSRNVLCWIRAADPGRFKVYVAHRIGEILDLTEKTDWRWVPTAENVADDGTRDAVEADLCPTSRWFRGPSFLWKPECQWPEDPDLVETSQEDLEVKKEFCLATVEAAELIQVENYSSWMRLVRVTGWFLRAVNIWKAKRRNFAVIKERHLTVSEIRDAVKFWITWIQESEYGEELDDIREGRDVSKSSSLKNLSPKLVDGLICVNTRLVNSPNLDCTLKFPPVLPATHPWTKLLLEWYHRAHLHVGVEKICNELRQRYWIVGMKSAVKKVARGCLECRMQNAKQVAPQMAPLPEVRVTRPNRPFTFVGVDYFGPMEMVNGRKHEKRYGALFTCLSTRAVHLEMAYSLSTDDVLMALHRFICRPGQPEEIWSDNGTNFRGADNEMKKALQEMDTDTVEDKLAAKGITWKFIPPVSPHFGGAWEQLVRSVKTAMITILKNRTLSDQVLLTVLAEAESSVNSRPLTIVSTDKKDSESITPNCFLIGTTSVQQAPGKFDDGDFSLRKRWRHAQVLANHFWSRWLKEYLPSLSLRAKWNRDSPEIQVGEVVFVPDPNQQRNQWIKGVVQTLFPGKDGRVRMVEVKTSGAQGSRKPLPDCWMEQ